MNDLLSIKSLEADEEKRILEEIKATIEKKKKDGLFTEKDIKDISAMRLRPLPDLLDVQGVYSPLDLD